METILHIGTDKTGSTAIQLALRANRDWFLERSVFIPETGFGVDNGHAVLLEALAADDLATLTRELARAESQGYARAIISWEGMCKYKPAQIRTLLRAIPTSSVRVLVYLREQADIMQSAHLQWVQMNPNAIPIASLACPGTPLERLRRYFFLRHPHRNYHALLLRWQSRLGQAAFTIRPFNAECLHAGDVISDFVAQLGVARDNDFQADSRPANPSLDVETALLLEQWRAQGLTGLALDTHLDLAGAIATEAEHAARYFFDRDCVNQVRRHYRASNARVAQIAQWSDSRQGMAERQCWLEESFSAVQQRAQARQQQVAEANNIPTMWQEYAGKELRSEGLLGAGWSEVEPWGVWSCADTSILRFRAPRRLLDTAGSMLEIRIVGKYYADNDATHVCINGLDLGWLDLSRLGGKLNVPGDIIGALQRITIELRHQHPVSPCEWKDGDDQRPLAFALSAIACQGVRL